ncbi:hypothetical protein D9M71_690550 [compost metagenome]
MREGAEAAIPARHPRHRCPGAGVDEIARHPSADRFAQAQTVAAVAGRRRRMVARAVRGMGKQLGDARAVVGEAAAGQHHAAAGADFGGRAELVEQGADHPAVAFEQATHRCFG